MKQQPSPTNTQASYDGVICSKDGTQLYFSQDSGMVSNANVAADGTLTLNTQITLPATLGARNNGASPFPPMPGLPAMNQHDKLASSMADAFQDFPDLTPYMALPNQIPLDTLNGTAAAKLQKAWRDRLAGSFPTRPNQKPDLADPVLLNHAIWYATKGVSTPYPGDRKVMYPTELKSAANRPDLD